MAGVTGLHPSAPHSPSLLQALRHHAQASSDRVALSYLERGEHLTETLNYQRLYDDARVIAGNLLAAGLQGRPVLIILPQGLDFVRCFLGCLYAGLVAVPLPFPVERRSAARCTAVARSSGACTVVTTIQALEDPSRLRCLADAGIRRADMVAIDVLRQGMPATLPDPDADSVAFLQFTSGSVSQPKGVVVTHRNIDANLAMIRAAFQQDQSNSAVSWLPLHHDMGLIGCVLQPLFLGAGCILMSPLAFLQRPLRWLQAIARYGATTAGAPNFAYDMCVRRVPEEALRTLDLSQWQLAFCGSEPIRHATMQRFVDRFALSGFPPGALLACYGQAEATLLVCATRPGEGLRSRVIGRSPHAHPAVSCGRPATGTRIITLSPATGMLADEGEICISGAQVSPGFWDGESASTRPDPARELHWQGRRFLRTGDIGRVLDGELYVTGRLRDMIILHGANHHAEDIEATVIAHAAAQVSGVGAFGVDAGDREALVIICELERHGAGEDTADLLARVSAAVAEAHGVLPREILAVAQGRIERTVSGKIQRAATRARFLAGDFRANASLEPLRHRGVE